MATKSKFMFMKTQVLDIHLICKNHSWTQQCLQIKELDSDVLSMKSIKYEIEGMVLKQLVKL